MKKTIAFIIATVGFCSYPDMLLSSIDKYSTLTPMVYIVYIMAVVSFAYFVRTATQEEMRQAYRQAERAARKAEFNEKMKSL